MSQSQNHRIKLFIRTRIAQGDWKAGDKIPSEQQLTKQFGVSRMTVNRALNELAMERCICRVQGVGSFVEKQVPQAPLFEIQSIRAEIEARGEVHSCRVMALESRPATQRCARRMGVPVGESLYYLEALHLSNGCPLQLERRFVRPGMAPEFLAHDFQAETASDYLLRAVAYTSLEHIVSAITPDDEIAQKLGVHKVSACLQLTRRTLIGDTVITDVDLIHPGDMFRLLGHITPQANADRIAS